MHTHFTDIALIFIYFVKLYNILTDPGFGSFILSCFLFLFLVLILFVFLVFILRLLCKNASQISAEIHLSHVMLNDKESDSTVCSREINLPRREYGIATNYNWICNVFIQLSCVHSCKNPLIPFWPDVFFFLLKDLPFQLNQYLSIRADAVLLLNHVFHLFLQCRSFTLKLLHGLWNRVQRRPAAEVREIRLCSVPSTPAPPESLRGLPIMGEDKSLRSG